MSLPVQHGSTDQSVEVRVLDSTDGSPEAAFAHDTAGIALWYRREGGAKTTITPAALAALTTAHTDGGVEYISDGYVRIDVPDAAFAAGASSRRLIALLGLRGAGKSTVGKLLSERLECPFFELDAQIERGAGLSLAEMFALHGEAFSPDRQRITYAEVRTFTDGE